MAGRSLSDRDPQLQRSPPVSESDRRQRRGATRMLGRHRCAQLPPAPQRRKIVRRARAIPAIGTQEKGQPVSSPVGLVVQLATDSKWFHPGLCVPCKADKLATNRRELLCRSGTRAPQRPASQIFHRRDAALCHRYYGTAAFRDTFHSHRPTLLQQVQAGDHQSENGKNCRE